MESRKRDFQDLLFAHFAGTFCRQNHLDINMLNVSNSDHNFHAYMMTTTLVMIIVHTGVSFASKYTSACSAAT